VDSLSDETAEALRQRCFTECIAVTSCVGVSERSVNCPSGGECCELHAANEEYAFFSPAIDGVHIKLPTQASTPSDGISAYGRGITLVDAVGSRAAKLANPDKIGPRTSVARTVQDLSAAGAATPPDCAGSAFLLNGCGPAKAEGTPSAEDCEDSGGLLAGCVVSATLPGQPGQEGTKQSKPYEPRLEPCNVSAVAQGEGEDSASRGIAVEVFVGVLIGSIVATALFTTLVVLALTAPKGESKAARVVRTLSHGTMSSSEIKVSEVTTTAKPSLQPQASLNFQVDTSSTSAEDLAKDDHV